MKNVNVTKQTTTVKEEPKAIVIFEEYYTKEGIVLGKENGVKGLVAKTARNFNGLTKEAVLDKFKAAYNNSTLDEGCYLDKAIAAGTQLIHKTILSYDNKEFINFTACNVIIGDIELFTTHPGIVDNIEDTNVIGTNIEEEIIL